MSITKTILITGASSGIGLATSRRLAAAGDHSEALTEAGEQIAMEAVR